MKIAVLGGGVSGLTLSFYLRRLLGPSLEKLTLIDQSKNVGGWVRSKRIDDFLFELGPASMRGAGPAAPAVVKLLEDAGLINSALGSSKLSNRRFLYVDKKMQQLPTSLIELFTSPLTRSVPWVGLREIFTARRSEAADESVEQFVNRHFGKHVTQVLVDAMVSGIYAGDISKLSVQSCFKILHDMEVKDRSIVLSILLSAIKPAVPPSVTLDTDVGKALLGTPSVSFKDGMQTLTDTLAELTFEVGEQTELMTSTSVQRLENIEHDSVRIHLDNTEPFDVDHVFSTVPIRSLHSMLSNKDVEAIDELNKSIGYVSVSKVHFGYNDLQLPYQGLGHLIPSREWEGVLGMLYNTLIFPEQTTGQRSSLTILSGGAHAPDKARLSGDRLVDFALEKVEEQLGVDAVPDVTYTQNLVDCIPQYNVGHQTRTKKSLETLRQRIPQLTVLGNHFHGVGLADCILNARNAAIAHAAAR